MARIERMLSLLKGIDPKVKFGLNILGTAVLLAIIFWRLDAREIGEAVFGQKQPWLGVGIVLSVAVVAARILKFRLLAAHNGLRADGLELARLMMLSLLFGIITPGRMGEATAVSAFKRPDRGTAIVLFLFDRIGDTCMILLLAIPGCIVFLGPYGIGIAVVVGIGVVCGIAVLQSQRVRNRLARLLFFGRLKVPTELLSQARVPKVYWLACLFTYGLTYLVITKFILGSQTPPGWDFVLLLPLVSFGAFGIREGLAAIALPLAGITPEGAVGAVFLIFVFTRVGAGLAGAAWTLALNVRRGMVSTATRSP